ncbi:MAG TPA: hypothetical protein EYN70_07560 [Planctomycetaceae bacterium]|nr:hypothetical protein [Planctomycetaceae bacterium]
MTEHICQLITTDIEASKLMDSSTKAYLDGTQNWIWVTTKELNQQANIQARHVFIYKTLVPDGTASRLENVLTHLREIYCS